MTSGTTAVVRAGIPAVNKSLYHRIRFLVGDPVAIIEFGPGPDSPADTLLILRDIEMGRAREHARVDRVACPADFAPDAGLSGDRETATAQATAECLRRAGVDHVTADRTLPLVFAHIMREAGIEVTCDVDLGVTERRSKDADELVCLREAQRVTEDAMRMACTMVAGATTDDDGVLVVDGAPLTSERVRTAIDMYLMALGYDNPTSIVAGGTIGADCHNHGSGPLRTGEPVIIDIFPRNKTTLYNGDCTRTVVHGTIPDAVRMMHAAVIEAKAAATAAVRPGVTGEEVHAATIAVISAHGYTVGLPAEGQHVDGAMTHGTGHGIGLDVHEPPLLDRGAPPLVIGDVLTIEPGVYDPAIGGVRVEDMVVVTADGAENFNELPEGLDWS